MGQTGQPVSYTLVPLEDPVLPPAKPTSPPPPNKAPNSPPAVTKPEFKPAKSREGGPW